MVLIAPVNNSKRSCVVKSDRRTRMANRHRRYESWVRSGTKASGQLLMMSATAVLCNQQWCQVAAEVTAVCTHPGSAVITVASLYQVSSLQPLPHDTEPGPGAIRHVRHMMLFRVQALVGVRGVGKTPHLPSQLGTVTGPVERFSKSQTARASLSRPSPCGLLLQASSSCYGSRSALPRKTSGIHSRPANMLPHLFVDITPLLHLGFSHPIQACAPSKADDWRRSTACVHLRLPMWC